MRLNRVHFREQPIWFALTLLTLGVFLYLRLNQLGTNPGWYSDEGSDLDIARHLAQGRWQYLALGGTPLVAARVPLFHLLLVGAFEIWGYDILTARLVVALFNVATALLLLIAVREMAGKWAALLSVLALGIMPNALLWSRIAFAYNVQAFFVVLCWYALWKFYTLGTRRWLLVASLAACAAYMTALTGLPLLVCVAIVTLAVKPRALIWSAPLMLLPGIGFLGLLYWTAPDALLQDLALTFGRTSDSIFGQLFNFFISYVYWFDWSVWVAWGFVGLFLIERRSVRYLTLLMFLAILFNVMRAFPGVGDLAFHRYLGILPFLALGAAQFLLRVISFLRAQTKAELVSASLPRWMLWAKTNVSQSLLANAALAVLLMLPLFWLAMLDIYSVSAAVSPLQTRLDSVSVTNPSDAREITDWVNARTGAQDVVLASPTIAWLLNAKTADFQQALAYEGNATDNYGKGLPRARFLFDASFKNADYVILDRLWRGWALQRMPALENFMRTVESWERVRTQGEFDVYQNPAR